MINLRTLAVLVSLAGVCVSSSLRAEMASGTYTNSFNDSVRIWDVSGTFNDGLEGFGLNYTLNMDDAGKFAGLGAVDVGGVADMDLSFWGCVKTASSNVTRVTLAMRFKGTVAANGMDMSFNVVLKEKLEIDADTGTLVGTVGGSVHVSSPALPRSISQAIPPTDIQIPLPVGMNGNWDLTLNVQPSGTHYTGDGEVKLSNGRTVPIAVTGSYSAKTDISKLTLKNLGTGGIVKLGLTSTLAGGQINIQRLAGKALGQALKAQTP